MTCAIRYPADWATAPGERTPRKPPFLPKKTLLISRRTMKRLVEEAGGELSAGVVFKRFAYGYHEMNVTLGDRCISGRVVAEGYEVEHSAGSLDSAKLRYVVGTIRTVLPSGGERTWWACPTCCRRAELLYLPNGRERLGCRRCCQLTYRSQRTAKPVKVRKARDVFSAGLDL